MITVVGMREKGYTTEQAFIERSIWKQTLNAYAVDRFIMVTPSTAKLENVSVPEQAPTMADALKDVQGEKVFLAYTIPKLRDAVQLEDFRHPRDAVYIFGQSGDNLLRYIEPADHVVNIKTPRQVDMFACSCVAAVLYARSLQA